MNDEDKLQIILSELKNVYHRVRCTHKTFKDNLTISTPPKISSTVTFEEYTKDALKHLEVYTYAEIADYNNLQVEEHPERDIYYDDVMRLLRQYVIMTILTGEEPNE
jgi:hypothetical protein